MCVRVAGVQLCGLLKLIHGIAALSSVPEHRSQLSVTKSVVWIEAFCNPGFCEALAEFLLFTWRDAQFVVSAPSQTSFRKSPDLHSSTA